MSRKNTTVRSSAAVTAALLVTALTAGPAMADHDHGQGKSRDAGRHAAAQHQGVRHQAGQHPTSQKQAAQKQAAQKSTGDDAAGRADGDHGNRGDRGRGDERGNGHTPVTVCHLLGNGGYHLLTMDDNALSAHLRHGDLYPVPDGGCPSEATVAPDESGTTTQSQESTEGEKSTTSSEVTEHAGVTGTQEAERSSAVVLGEQAFARTRTGASVKDQAGTVAGVEATRGANRAAPVAGPVAGPLAGILPQTGADAALLGALVAGAGLLAGGVALTAWRRQDAR
jgi:LPXTG-motif cell wall-anchored protein